MFGRNIISLGVAVNLQNNFSSQAGVVTKSMIGLNATAVRLAANSQRMISNGFSGMLAGAAILYPFNEALKTYGEYVHIIAQIKATGELTGSQLSHVSDKIKEVGRGSVYTVQQIAEATRELARQGMPFNVLMKSIGSISDIGQATGTNIQASSEFMSDLMSIYPESIRNTDLLASRMVLASNRSRASIESLAHSFHYFGATAKLLDMPLTQSTALLMRLADVGLKGHVGGTTADNAMRFYARAIGRLPGDKLGKSGKALAIMGLGPSNFKEADGHLMRLDRALELMMSRVSKIKDRATRLNIIGAIFGERGKKAATIANEAMPGKSMADYVKQLEGIDPALAKRQAWETTNNIWGDIAKLKDAIYLLKINVIEPLAPALRIVVKTLTSGVDLVSRIGSSKAGSYLLGLMVVIGGALTIWGSLNFLIGKGFQLLMSTVPAWAKFGVASRSATGQAATGYAALIALQRASLGLTNAQTTAQRALQYQYTNYNGVRIWRNPQTGRYAQGPQTHMNTGQGLMYGAIGSAGLLGGSSRLARTAVSYGARGRMLYGLAGTVAGIVPKLLGWGFALSVAWSAIDLFRDHTNDAAEALKKENEERARILEIIPLDREFQMPYKQYQQVMQKPNQIIINLDGREYMRKLINEKDTETYLGLNYE